MLYNDEYVIIFSKLGGICLNIFEIVGNDFFKPLSSPNKEIYYDCLNIIYNSYRTELSYGIDRDIVISQLCDYFERDSGTDIIFDDDGETLKDSRGMANAFLRNLKKYGWIESEFSNDRKEKIIMPSYSVTFMQTMNIISANGETEYQSEISTIYSILINEELLSRPYPQIVKPVYEHTLKLFTELKKLNTDIRKYIEELTEGQTPEEIMEHFFGYNENIASKAYHRLHTSDNVTRFRNIILNRLNEILNNGDIMKKCAIGYQNIEDCNDYDEAFENVRRIINDITEHFRSYDEIESEIQKKHTRYLNSAVNRARMAFLNTNNMEGKLSSVLRMLAYELDNEENYSYDDDASDEVCRIFNMFPQSFLSGESLYTVPISKKITNVEEIFIPEKISEEERLKRRQAVIEKNNNRFSKKNIRQFVFELLKDKKSISASEIPVNCKRDMIRIIFINMYGRDKKSDYIIIPKDETVQKEGFSFRDFTIKRRVK